MKFILPIVLAVAVYLTPLYPVYAQVPAPALIARPELEGRVATAPTGIKREIVKDKMEDKKDKIASRGAMLKEKLLAFRDKKKAQLVDKINSVLVNINQRRTDMMTDNLKKMSDILSKIEERINQASQNGKDVASARDSISKARSAIETAQTAVDAQKTKDYTVSVSSESAVRNEVQTSRDNLYNDLKSAHELVIACRTAVSDALKAAAAVFGVSTSTK